MATGYVSLNDISDEIGVSVRTLRYWAARQMLPGAVRYGRTWRVQRTSYEDWKLNKHIECERKIWSWPHSTNELEARSGRPDSTSTGTASALALEKVLNERLRKRQMRKRSV